MGTQMDIGGGTIVESPWVFVSHDGTHGIEHNGVRIGMTRDEFQAIIESGCAALGGDFKPSFTKECCIDGVVYTDDGSGDGLCGSVGGDE